MCGMLLDLPIVSHLGSSHWRHLVNLLGHLGGVLVLIISHNLLSKESSIGLDRLLKRQIFLILMILVHGCCHINL
jgi:hypothetical protein